MFLNVLAQTENESDTYGTAFMSESNQFPKYHMKTFLEILMQRLGRKLFSTQQLEVTVHTNLILIMGVTVVNFATSKNMTVNNIMCSHHIVYERTQLG
jgi:hypothetical protein